MQAVKSTKVKAKAVTEKILSEKRESRLSLLSKLKNYIHSILFGNINDINTNSDKIRNHENYMKAKQAQNSTNTRIRTLFK